MSRKTLSSNNGDCKENVNITKTPMQYTEFFTGVKISVENV